MNNIAPSNQISGADSEGFENEADLDPRIQRELNVLNQTSAEINKLENELDEARCNYKMTFTEASQRLAQAAEKRRKQIQRARAYFELKEEAKKAQGESLKAARQYQSAISVYRAAKETVTLAEERLLQKGEGNLSAAWQEMMNHATMRVMEAELEKRNSEERHQIVTSQCAKCDKKLKELEKKFKNSIKKASPYFEVKHELDIKLQHQKQNVTDLQAAIKDRKFKYSQALGNLEKISEEIHQLRREKILLMFPRQPGVGAESGSSLSSIVPELNLEEAALDGVSGEICDSPFEADETNTCGIEEDISFKCSIDPDCENGEIGSDVILETNSLDVNKSEEYKNNLTESEETKLQTWDNCKNCSEQEANEQVKDPTTHENEHIPSL